MGTIHVPTARDEVSKEETTYRKVENRLKLCSDIRVTHVGVTSTL